MFRNESHLTDHLLNCIRFFLLQAISARLQETEQLEGEFETDIDELALQIGADPYDVMECVRDQSSQVKLFGFRAKIRKEDGNYDKCCRLFAELKKVCV